MIGKKGSFDNIVVPVYLLIIAGFIIAALMAIQQALPGFSMDAGATNLLKNAEIMYERIGNTGFLMITFALVLFNLLGAFLLVTHPIFVMVDILLLPFTIFLASVLSNAYEASLYTLTSASTLQVMNYIMLNLPQIMVVADVIVAIAAYALIKNRYG